MSQILKLADYKKRRELTSSAHDDAIQAALYSAEDAVEKYTGRDFTKAQEAATESYTWDYGTILDVDDFVGVTAVAVDGRALRSTEYDVGPREGETYYWIDFSRWWQGSSYSAAQMGFRSNADVRYEERLYLGGGTSPAFTVVEITATFGWPEGAPASVQQAVVFLVDEFRKNTGTAGDIQAESIADVSYVYQRQPESPTGLPARVMQLLEPFRRVVVG